MKTHNRLIHFISGIMAVAIHLTAASTAFGQESAGSDAAGPTTATAADAATNAHSPTIVVVAGPRTSPLPEKSVMQDLTVSSPLVVPSGHSFILTDIVYSSEVDFVINSSANFPHVSGRLRLSASYGLSSSGTVDAPEGHIFDTIRIPGSESAAGALSIDWTTTMAVHVRHMGFRHGIAYPQGARLSHQVIGPAGQNPNNITLIGYFQPDEPVFTASDLQEALQKIINGDE